MAHRGLALERLEAELGGADYLVGQRFTVADLTAASPLYPLVLPPEAPQLIGEMPEPYERFRAPLRDRRGYRWVQEIFRCHRHPRGAGGVDPGRHGEVHAGQLA